MRLFYPPHPDIKGEIGVFIVNGRCKMRNDSRYIEDGSFIAVTIEEATTCTLSSVVDSRGLY